MIMLNKPIQLVSAIFITIWMSSSATATGLSQLELKRRSWLVPKGVKFGNLDRLKLDQNDDLRPSNNNGNIILVATRAIGLNFADIFSVLGYYKAANIERGDSLEAFCPGLEFSGTVLRDDSNCFQQGERVFGFTRFGAYTDVVQIYNPRTLCKLPSKWSFEQGAAFLVNALTAWYGLINVAGMPNNCKSRKVVLVHSASGGVGLWASEIAARRGALVVGVVGREEKKKVFYERVQVYSPCSQCIVRADNAEQFAKDLRDAVLQARSSATCMEGAEPPSPDQDLADCGWGIDYVMESYGGKYFKPSLDLINAGGSMATYGSTSYNGSGRGGSIPFLPLVWQYLTRPRIDPGELTSRNVRVGGFNLIFLTENIDELWEALRGCITCLSGEEEYSEGALGKVTPPVIANTFSFDNGAVNALSVLRSGTTVGKVVVSNEKNPNL